MTGERGVLPPGWVWTTLGEITQPIEKVDPSQQPDFEFTYLDIASIDNSVQRIADPKHYRGAKAPSRARQLVRANDVLFSTVRTYLKNIALVPAIYDGQIASTGFSVLRGGSGVLGQYLFYYCLTDDFLSTLAELQRGTSYPAVRDSDVRAQRIPVAPFSEQRRIVAEIEKQFTRLDAGVAALKRVQANLTRYRASVLKAACEGRLAPQDPNDEPAERLLARILAERRAKWDAEHPGKRYVEPGAPETDGLPDLPAGWCWTTIGLITECLDHLRIPVSKKERANRSGTVPYYGANGQVGWIDTFIFDEPLILVVEDETFTGREKSFSYKITGRSWVNNHAHVLRPSEAVDVDFLNYSLAYYPFTPLTTGTTGRRKLTQFALTTAVYPLAPLPEQRRIVAEVERRLSVVAKLEATAVVNLARASRLRQAVLKRAFEGRLMV